MGRVKGVKVVSRTLWKTCKGQGRSWPKGLSDTESASMCPGSVGVMVRKLSVIFEVAVYNC